MAIPFFEEDHVSNSEASGDQVDSPMAFSVDPGHDQVDFEGPPPAAEETPPPGATSEPVAPPSAEEQLLAWKILAITMCKVLKQFYLQHKSSGKSSKLKATVQIQPQAQ
ncbi:uncharacterized protein LOC113564034 [Drosophila erecta]|uniref:Uncharacterized protein n=1 Tax=Drosophila erecta TaxID=7220 RepID=B3ND77_DROER|nr:uncharacterized protein LOC6546303 [Drosophila erecta]XP_026833996.1 uncharacterized protein LOC113564034 [Drosophila erecta]EDV51870.1 uncharacterized protein Dere_GG15744 [Drosophila erecta]